MVQKVAKYLTAAFLSCAASSVALGDAEFHQVIDATGIVTSIQSFTTYPDGRVSFQDSTSSYVGIPGNILAFTPANFTPPGQVSGWTTKFLTNFLDSDDSYVMRFRESLGSLNQNGVVVVNKSTGLPSTVMRDNDLVPGINVAIFPINQSSLRVSSSGLYAFSGNLDTTTGQANATNKEVVLTGNLGSLSVLYRQNDPIPSLPTGSNWGLSLGSTGPVQAIGSNGDVAILTRLQNAIGQSTQNVMALVNPNGSIRVLAISGTSAPGGGTYGNLNAASTNTSKVIFSHDHRTVFEDGGNAIFVDDYSQTVRWIGVGDTIPGHPTSSIPLVSGQDSDTFNPLVASDIAPGGRVLAAITLNTSGTSALLFGATGDIHTIAFTGDSLPGLPDGVSLLSISHRYFNQVDDDGDIVFSATLQGTGITTNNDRGWFVYQPNAGLHLLFQENGTLDVDGQTVNVGPESSLILSNFALRDDGIFSFASGGHGYTLDIHSAFAAPEPTSLALLAAGVALLSMRRRTKRQGS